VGSALIDLCVRLGIEVVAGAGSAAKREFCRARAARSGLNAFAFSLAAPALLFASGTDELTPAARAQLDRIAQTLLEVTAEIPPEIDWVLRIDGHTDKRPINTARFPSNWELSTARAIAIVKHLVVSGIQATRLAANGFGEFRPLDPADTPAAHAINRRIEIQLTNR